MRRLMGSVATTAVAAGLVLASSALAAEYELKLGHANDPDPENSIFHAFSLQFQDLVHEHTDGRIEVVIFPAMQLGGEQEQIRGTQIGTQEATLVSMTNLNALAPTLGFFTLPYVFESTEEGRYVIDNAWDQINEWAIEDAGVRILTITDAGFRVLSNSARPVNSLDDLQGLKIRLPQNPIMISAFESWGVSPIPIDWSETFNALQQRVVDGQENPINVLLAVKFYEVQDYVTDIDWIFQTGALVVSEEFFQSLPEDLQGGLVQAGQDAMAWVRDYVEQVTEEDIRRLREDHGVQFAGRPSDFDEWVTRARTVWPSTYDYIGKGDEERGREIVEQIRAIAEKHHQQ